MKYPHINITQIKEDIKDGYVQYGNTDIYRVMMTDIEQLVKCVEELGDELRVAENQLDRCVAFDYGDLDFTPTPKRIIKLNNNNKND